jgi:hypothetical protein
MKKLFTLIAILVAFTSFGQEILKWHKVTNYASTSDMVWSNSQNEYVFVDNKNYQASSGIWDITIDIAAENGFVTSGAITYRVNKITIREQDGISMAVMDAFNERLGVPVMIIASTIDDKFKIAVYVEARKKVYYFYE